MKRILSVILSLALLASALIIPMSVSAEATEAETAAAQAVINAVNGLKVDLNAVNPIELAVPVDSREAVTDAPPKGSEDDPKYSHPFDQPGSLDHITIAASDDPTVGTTTVKVKEDNPVTASAWGLKEGDLHAIKYSVNVPEKMSYVKGIDYIVVYVKTNRSLKMRLGTHNGYSYAGAITDDIQVDANDTYQPVVLSLRDGFAKKYHDLYSFDKPFTRGFYLSIASMTDGNNTITASDNITFGSILYVPGDTAARDFKYNLSTERVVADRFTAADGVTAEMLIAAEKIENDGRYTADSFAALQSAISAAKKVLIDKNNETEVVDLFKEEVERLYKLEEVFRPKYVETGDDENSLASTPGDISNLGLTADQQESFGDYVAVATKANARVHFVDANAGSRFPGDNSYLKTYANYKNLYLAVYNTGNAFEATRFSFYKQYDDGIALVNKKNNKFELHNGYYLYSLYSTSVVNYQERFLLDYAANVHSGEDHPITQANRVQVQLDKAIPADENVYFGSILGEVAFNTSTIDTDVTNKATLVSFYAANIVNKGYENSAAVEETMELLGITTVPVVRELGNTIGITETSVYTLNAAVVGENVSFTLDNIPAGVDVTVKYGEDTIVPGEGDVYTITVAEGKELHIIPSHSTTEYTKEEITPKFNEAKANNVALNIVPKLYKYDGSTRTEKLLKDEVDIEKLSNGNLSDSNADVSFDITFKNKVNGVFGDDAYVNKYTPGEAFDFNQEFYDAYVDLVYDLGRPTNINKFQHIAASDSALAMGVYQLYASDSATNLFSEDGLICNYQNTKQEKYSQEIEFPTRTAQYVAIRCYMPITKCDASYNKDAATGSHFYNCFRIGDIAIYGTPSDTAAYKVTEIQAPTDNNPVNIDANSLLKSDTLMSIKGYENGVEIGNITIDKNNTDQQKLHSGTYQKEGGHGDFNTAVFYDSTNSKLKNGFAIDRTGIDGNIKFRTQGAETTIHSDFTYDLGSYYKIDRFELYSVVNTYGKLRTQSYEVYIGNDLATLYEGTPVAVYNNYYNTFAQSIKFAESQIGKYLGVRILMPADRMEDVNYVRLDELAAYGTKVGAPADANLKADITSKSGYIYNKNGKSIYTNETDGSERTALRLTVGYKSPKVPGGADASKIILPNGAEANVIERNVIAIAKSKYDKLDDDAKNNFGINTTGASVTISTATSTKYPVSNYFKSEAIKDENGVVNPDYCMAYGALNINNISKDNASKDVVVRGRVVYEYQGEIYAVYSDIVGISETVSAQAAYNKLNDLSQGWFN